MTADISFLFSQIEKKRARSNFEIVYPYLDWVSSKSSSRFLLLFS